MNLSLCLFSVVLKMELSCPLLDAHLCCNPTKAPFLTPRVRCLVFPASLALSKLLYNSWLTHPLQCGKQVVPPRAEGSRSRTDGCSVSFWGGVEGTAWVLYITLSQHVPGRCYRTLSCAVDYYFNYVKICYICFCCGIFL